MKKAASIVFFALLAVLLLDNGLGLGIGENLINICRVCAGLAAVIIAITEV